MANNTTWQVAHYLAVVIYLIMFIAGIATYIANAQILRVEFNPASLNADLYSKTIVWAVGGVVSSLPPRSRCSPKVPILINFVYLGHRWSHMHSPRLLAPPLSSACVASGDHTRSVLSQAQDRLHIQHHPTGLPRHC